MDDLEGFSGGILRLLDRGEERRVPLAAETLIGRSRQATWTITDPRSPSIWMEVRWFEGEGWGWRDGMAQDTETIPRTASRASGAMRRQDFKRLTTERGAQLNRHTRAVLLRDAPPAPFAVDLDTEDLLVGAAFDQHVEVLEGRARAADWEDQPGPTRTVPTLGVLRSAGRFLRVVFAERSVETEQGRELRIPADDLHLELGVRDGRVTGSLRWIDHGLCIDTLPEEAWRILVPYALHLRDFGPGVMMGPVDAFVAWRAVGGNPGSKSEMLALHRRRLREQLDGLGVLGADRLLVYKRGPGGGVTLNLRQGQVEVDEDALLALDRTGDD